MNDDSILGSNDESDELKNFEELKAEADAGELTPASLQEQLNNYSEALKQEYETSVKENPDNVEEYTRDFFKRNVHSMAAQVVWLANNSDSDSVRLSACKYGIGIAITQSEEDGDPIKNLLKELTTGAKKKQTVASNN